MRARGEKRVALRRVLAAALCLCMVLSLFTGMTLRGSETSDTPQPAADEVVVVPEIVDPGTADQPAADVPADQPVTEPETEVPSEPEATLEPVVPSEPEQTAEPTEPEATPEPVVPVEPTAAPEATPEPGTEATPEPGGSQEPEATEEPIPTPEVRDDVCKHHPVHTPECFYEQNGFCGFQCPICNPELFGGITGAVTVTVPGTVSAQKSAEEGGPVRADLLAGVEARDLEGAGCAVAVFSVVDSQGQPVTVIDGRYIDVTPGQNYVIVYVATNETGMILAAADRELSADAAITAAGSDFTIDGQPAKNEFIYEQNGLTVKLTLSGAAVTKTSADANGEAMPAAPEIAAPAEVLAEPEMELSFFEEGSQEYAPFAAFFENGDDGTDGAEEAAAEDDDLKELLAMFVMKPELTLNGAELDLSGCTAKAEVTVTNAAVPQDEIATIAAEGEEEHVVDLSAMQNGMSGVEEVDRTTIDLLTDAPAAVNFADIPDDGIMVVALEETANVEYTIQSYLWFDHVQKAQVGNTDQYTGEIPDTASNSSTNTYWENHLVFIDTQNPNFDAEDYTTYNHGGRLPANGLNTNALSTSAAAGIFAVTLVDSSGNVQPYFNTDNRLVGYPQTTEMLVPMFMDEPAHYKEKPQIGNMSRLFNTGASEGGDFNENYILSEVWVYQPGTGSSPTSNADPDPTDFVVYKIHTYNDPALGAERSSPERIRFTNNKNNTRLTIPWKGDTPAEAAAAYVTATTVRATGTLVTGENMKLDGTTDTQMRVVRADLSHYESAYPYDYTILVQEGTVIRFIYRTTSSEQVERPANFFDYDITDGFIYTSTAFTNPQSTANQTNATWYTRSNSRGINSAALIGTGARYAFGNANSGTGLGNVLWGSQRLNAFNGADYGNNGNVVRGGRGCTFGLVTSLTTSSNNWLNVPVFSNNVAAPNIFGPEDMYTTDGAAVPGKTTYSASAPNHYNTTYYLDFQRNGGTYILQGVTGRTRDAASGNITSFTAGSGYDHFTDTYYYMNGNGGYRPIMGNLFWPLDNAPSHGTDGHDLKFGSHYYQNNRKYGAGVNDVFPVADDGDYDHNCNIGMSYTVEFTIKEGYIAPLEYWFYGDDDMWVFLDQPGAKNAPGDDVRLIADIGGVHSSVGTYVNLWDYIEPIAYNDNGIDESQTYRMTIFYTERGESGSTCYMRFTVPLDLTVTQTIAEDNELVVEKQQLDANNDVINSDEDPNDSDRIIFVGQDSNEWPSGVITAAGKLNPAYTVAPGFFIFRIKLQNANGQPYNDVYDYAIYSKNGVAGPSGTNPGNHRDDTNHTQAIAWGTIGDVAQEDGYYYFALKSNEYIVISGLPDDVFYTVEELTSDGFVTGWQQGTHDHNNGSSFTLDSDEVTHYTYTASNPPDPLDIHETNYIRFTNSPALKTETDPGDREGVQVGDVITYDVFWVNDRDDGSQVVIRDKLDQGNGGVDFVAAKFGRDSDPARTWWAPDPADIEESMRTGEIIYHQEVIDGVTTETIIFDPHYYYSRTANSGSEKESITDFIVDAADAPESAYSTTVQEALERQYPYNGGNGTPTVIWIRSSQARNVEDAVSLQVRVNENAKAGDFTVENRGSVQVGNESFVLTNDVTNPVWDPLKTETHIDSAIGGNRDVAHSSLQDNGRDDRENGIDYPVLEGPMVYVGDKVTYRVTWRNYLTEPASIMVRDPLDRNVRYVDGTAKAYTVELDDETGLPTAGTGADMDIAGEYDPESHTITWDLGVQAPGAEGYVEFTVEVLPGATPVGEILNHAYVDVTNQSGQTDTSRTNTIENPTPDLMKEETDPGEGDQVQVGDLITYRIRWENYQNDPAQVIIDDPLDPGLDFVSASFGEATPTLERQENTDGQGNVTYTYPAAAGYLNITSRATGEPVVTENVPVKIEYNETTRTVVWTVGDDAGVAPGVRVPGGAGRVGVAQGGEELYVYLTVQVNKDGVKDWDYGDGGVDDDERSGLPTASATEKDYQVLNRAAVKVGNDPRVRTNIVDNPIPDKTETQAGTQTNPTLTPDSGSDYNDRLNGPTVHVGDEITYRVDWKNGYDQPAVVVINDPLDPGVDFVSASFGGATLQMVNGVPTGSFPTMVTVDGVSVRLNIELVPATTGDPDSRETVRWTIGETAPGQGVPAGWHDFVTLIVRVNADAVPTGWVNNTATVTVNNDSADTPEIWNPVPKLTKTEPSPGPGAQVITPGDSPTREGSLVDYAIEWNNYKSAPAYVQITDYLDPGVEFVSAEFGGTEYTEGKTSSSENVVTLRAGGTDTATGTVILNNHDSTGAVTKTASVSVTITYTPADRLITWTLGVLDGPAANNVPEGFTDSVRFTVQVNDTAKKQYLYDDDGRPSLGDHTVNDDYILNQGGIVIDHDPKILTNIIENPTKPQKTETEINDNDVSRSSTRYVGDTAYHRYPDVRIGDKITYNITWLNSAVDGSVDKNPVAATVVIHDPLDEAVDFVSASFDGVVLNANNGSSTSTTDETKGVTIAYDAGAHEVIWTLADRPAMSTGIVELDVLVNRNASTKDPDTDDRVHVQNQARVEVGNQVYYTDFVENLLVGDLDVTKIVTGQGNDLDDFSFMVTLYRDGAVATDVDGVFGDPNDPFAMEFTDGVATFTLRHNQTMTALGLPAPLQYEVQELNENQNGYITTYQGEVGTVPAGSSASATVTNYLPPTIPSPSPTPGGEPHKTETDPGDKVPVEVGQLITYRIDWVNYRGETATVTIRDPLDIGVDFYDATYQDHTLSADQQSVEGEGTGPNGPTKWRISQGTNATTGHTEITWELGEKASGASGSVYLRVLVTDRAVQKDDLTVYNQAFVKVNGDPEQATEIPENPVPTPGGGPHKVETEPGDKLPVEIGDQITYRIDWENYRKEAATVAIRDPLDPGVKFVSASYGGVTLTAANDSTEGDAVTADNRTVHITMRQGTDTETGRTVVYWDLGEHPSTFKDSVYLTVEVTEKALDNADLTVYNQAFVKVNGDPEQETEIPENPIPTPDGQPHKVETDPGDKVPVQVGQEITYRIDWVNYRPVTATVSVRDPLDPGVEFVSASYGGVTLTADRTSTQGDARTADGRTVHISMWQGTDTDTGRTVVYWDLGEHPTEFKDSVILTVRVTEKALEKADLTVYNQAFVKVNGDPEKETEIPENPVPTPDGQPHKIETDPGDGENTIVGQVITYQIQWTNYEDVPAAVKIRDPLDIHVDFVSASDGGVYTNEDHTVRWDLGEKPAQSSGYVELRVVVTERAKEPGIVYNQAFVQIGNNPEQETEIPENPVPDGEPHKTEVDPGDKKPVDVRQIIMYRIDWWNYKGVPATITIRDPLDVGLTFFGATDGGVYDSATRTVTWNLGEKAPGDSGSVFLRCIVNPRARNNGIVKNQAYVKVGNDPEQETEIPENPVPTPTPTPPRPTRKPNTGDNNDPGLWLAVLAAMSFGAGAAGTVIHRRRRKEK